MAEDKQPKPKKFQPHFPTTKIKKIIQENQDIGKLSNLVPPLVEQSLEFFLVDLLKKCQEVSQEYNVNKLTPPVLKKALLSLHNYEFLRDVLEDVEEISSPIPSKSKISASRQPKRAKPEQGKEEKEQPKKGRKRQKLSGDSEEPNSVEVDE